MVGNESPGKTARGGLREKSSKALDKINGILKGFGWAANPADLTGKANSEQFPEIMEAMINEPGVGTLAIASAGREQQADQAEDAERRTGEARGHDREP